MKEVITDFVRLAMRFARNRKVTLLFLLTFFAMLATTLLFVTTREATIGDLLVSLIAMIAVPGLFFLLQAMCLNYTETTRAGELLKSSVKLVGKLALASLPLFLIGFSIFLVFTKLDTRFGSQLRGTNVRNLTGNGETWPQVIFSSLRLIIFGFALPLVSTHVWIALKHKGIRDVFGSTKTTLSTAFGLRSVRTYAVGFVVFGVLPYILISIRTPSDRAWLEVSLLTARLLLASLFVLIGWITTIGVLQKESRSEA